MIISPSLSSIGTVNTSNSSVNLLNSFLISEVDPASILPTVVEVYFESFKRAKSMSKLDKRLAKLLLDCSSLVSASSAASLPSITLVLLSTWAKVSSAFAIKASVSNFSTSF